MSVSLNLVGVVAPDENYQRKVAAWRALVEAGLHIPDELHEYFNYDDPDPSGLVVELATRDYHDEGLEIAIADLPDNLTHIRAFLSA